MAGAVVESTKSIIFTYGPNIVRSDYWEQYQKKPGWMGRMQAAPGPHKSGGDPHIAGRALDIVLRSWVMSEKKVADELVQVFLNLRAKLNFIAVIYNGWEWNGTGQKFTRGGDAINRHISHIHIEWSSADMGLSGFEPDLTQAVQGMAPSDTDYEF